MVINSPHHLAKLNLILPILNDKVFLGIEERYTSKKMTRDGSNTPEFFLTNLTLFSKNILKNLEVSAKVYNLFDKRYGDSVASDFTQNAITQDGRTFRLKLTYAF
jgi:outer membrane receptor for ferrienterochelin and colicins